MKQKRKLYLTITIDKKKDYDTLKAEFRDANLVNNNLESHEGGELELISEILEEIEKAL